MTKLLPLALMLLLAFASPARAKDDDPAFMKHFFAPELVLKNAREIGLTPQQRSAITKDIGRVTGDTTELQLRMVEGFGAVEDLAAADPVDEKALLGAIREVLDAELKVKEAHMGLLIRMRNLLTPEQREKLTELRGDS
jgi:Spy/CpxP family protein refolding chaperone